MNHILIGIAAALGGCVLLLAGLAVVLVRRAGRRADARVGEVVQALEARMDDLAHELAGAVERAEEEGRRNRFLGDIAGSIDLEVVLARTLEAAGGLSGADAAAVQIDSHEAPVVSAVGMPAEEAARHTIAGPPDGRRPRAVEVSYRYAADEEGALHAGLAVPLEVEEAGIGYLAVYTREPDRRFGDEDVRRLEELAERAAPAVDNARRFREARRLADLDALTGLHNRRYFHETLARECARAHRYGRQLSLIVFDLDDFKDVNDRIGHLAGDAVLAEASSRLREVVRSADVPCRVGGDEFAVVLPESGLDQAQQLFARIQSAVSGSPIGHAGRLYLSAGLAELKAEDDAVSFFERADEALYRAKDGGKGRSAVA